jgi:hypothetical protein
MMIPLHFFLSDQFEVSVVCAHFSPLLKNAIAVVDIFTPDYMIQKLDVRPGDTLECIAWLRQRGSTRKWYANCLWRVTDPHAEILVRGSLY